MKPREYFELLVHTALVDGQLHPAELPHLQAFAERLRLSRDEARAILAAGQGGARPAIRLPAGRKDRGALFRHMARIAVADHRLAPEEMDLLVKVGQALGMGRELVYDEVERAMRAAGGPPLAPDAPPEPALALPPEDEPPLELAPDPDEPRIELARAPEEPKLELVESDPAERRPAGRGVVHAPPVDPLARADYGILRDLARNMKVVAVVLWLIPGVVSVLFTLVGLYSVVQGHFPALVALVVVGLQALQTAVLLGIGWNTWAAAGKFELAASSRTAQNPVRRIMAGLSHLYTVFWIQMALAVLLILTGAASVCLLTASGGLALTR